MVFIEVSFLQNSTSEWNQAPNEVEMGSHCRQDASRQNNLALEMNTTQRTEIMQRWQVGSASILIEKRTPSGRFKRHSG